jgi:hypothetical protein
MAKPKSKEKQLKRLYNQLKKHELMKNFRVQETSSKKVPTRKTRIEKAIQTLENTKK